MATAIGKMIKEEMRRQGFGVTAFSKKLSCSRGNVYDIFKRHSVDTSLLTKVSKALRVSPSFFYEQGYAPSDDFLIAEDGGEGYQTPISKLQKENVQQQQEIDNLKKLVKLLEEKEKKKEATIGKLEEKIKRLTKTKK